MYNLFQTAFKYLNYRLTASNGKGHGIHSPFVFNFIKDVLNDRNHYADYEKVEKLRDDLINNRSVINVEDFGAGSSVHNSDKRSISSIAKNAAKTAKYGQLLYRIVKYYQPSSILELGTSLGITTSYLSLANTQSKIVTIEGSEAITEVANKNFRELNIKNVELLRGNFDDKLPDVLNNISTIDLAFIDGNHRKEPVARYFEQILPKINDGSIIIFDDIHWSREMEEAWEIIKQHPAVTCSIDIFFIGIAFFKKSFKEKQHFTIRF